MSIARQVLQRLYEATNVGLADHELATLCPAICSATVRGARKDLERNDLCSRTGRTSRTPTGCYGAVYVITSLGRQYIESGRELPPKQFPDTDDSILRRIAQKIKQGYDFQCGRIEGEKKYYAGFFDNTAKRCEICGAPSLEQDILGISDSIETAILKALNHD